jgi:iron(III) transport system substrate-binding protein
MRGKWLYPVCIVFCLLFAGCASRDISAPADSLVVYSPHPLEFIDPIVGEFENETGIAVEVVTAGTGELLARIESETGDPQGDILWGGSLSLLESKKDLFVIYRSENEDHALYKNTDGHITRFTIVPSVIMVNTNLIGHINIDGYGDLLNPALKGKIAFADPSKSSSSYEQLLTQLHSMGKGDMEAGWEYVRRLAANLDGKLLNGSPSVYNGVVQGEYTVGLTFEEPAAKYMENGAPIKIVYPVEGTIVRPDGVSIIKNAKHLDSAKAFVDFVTSKEIQTLIATELNRRSIRDDVPASESLMPYDSMTIIEDDQKWSSDNKVYILNRYKKILEDLYE